MPAFQYVGQTLSGKKVSGQIEAYDATDAKSRIRSMKMIPIEIKMLSAGQAEKKIFGT